MVAYFFVVSFAVVAYVAVIKVASNLFLYPILFLIREEN